MNQTKSSKELSERFLKITEAYEFLQKHNKVGETTIDWTNIISKTDEQLYREACKKVLGLEAEVVEESKRCPLFRDWLKWNTDSAFHWNNFFMLNGGLAPMSGKNKTLSVGTGEYEGIRRRKKTKFRHHEKKINDMHVISCLSLHRLSR